MCGTVKLEMLAFHWHECVQTLTLCVLFSTVSYPSISNCQCKCRSWFVEWWPIVRIDGMTSAYMHAGFKMKWNRKEKIENKITTKANNIWNEEKKRKKKERCNVKQHRTKQTYFEFNLFYFCKRMVDDL